MAGQSRSLEPEPEAANKIWLLLAIVTVLAVTLASGIWVSIPRGHTYKNSTGMRFRRIPPGTFLMGSPASDPDAIYDEKPQQEVTITQPFYMAVTEVTQAQWKAVMRTAPWQGQSGVKEGDDYPVSFVSWQDATEFCRRLNAADKKGWAYRLPTEAEWEYASRAGTETRYSFGNPDARLSEYAWFQGNTNPVGEAYAHEVGQKRANQYGLFDTYGNVWEWCLDGPRDYEETPQRDPVGPRVEASMLVFRGGCWGSPARDCRAAKRSRAGPRSLGKDLGFRVVAVPPGSAGKNLQR